MKNIDEAINNIEHACESIYDSILNECEPDQRKLDRMLNKLKEIRRLLEELNILLTDFMEICQEYNDGFSHKNLKDL